MRNADYLEAYETHLHEEDKSKRTVVEYVSDVKDLMSFIKKDIKKLKKTDVSEFKDYLRKRNLKTISINRKLVGVKQFVDFVNDRYDLSITARIKQEKVQKQYSLKDEELLTEDDFKRLITAIEEVGDCRAKALFETMYYSGMRISEALQLRVDHVQNGYKVIEDIKGKGSKYRDIYMSDKLLKSLREYLKIRHQPFSSTTKALFVGERGPITRQTANYLMRKYAKAAEIEISKAHVHNLRHLFGLRLAAQGQPIEVIAKYLGHTSIEVTKIYLEKPQSHYVNLIDQL
jgi:integrase/recombinase XerD